MAEKIQTPLLLDLESLLCVADAAHDCLKIANQIQETNTNMVQLDFGTEDAPAFEETPIERVHINIPSVGFYPFIQVIFNGVKQPEGAYQIVPMLDFAVSLRPPRSAWLMRTHAILDAGGEYHDEDNRSPHSYFMLDTGEIKVHDGYSDLYRDPLMRQPITEDVADSLVRILDIPRMLLHGNV